MKSSMRKKVFAFVLIFCILVEPVLSKRGGGGGSRGSSGARTGGGGFGRSRPSNTGGGYRPNTGGTSGGHYGNTGGSNYGLGNNNRQSPNTGYGTYGNNRQSSNTGGGWFGGNNNRQSSNTGGGFFKSSGGQTSRFNKGSGIGSMVRSNTFKNAIVGAAAGYLLYQGGKHLIRSAMSPMMWGNRQYYWGSNYYQPRPNMQMCRMPLDQSDPQFGNIYFQDQTRPKEIVWSCGFNEHCCGYECCPSTGGYGAGGYNSGYNGGYNGGGGYFRNNSYRSFGFGSLLVLLLISCCGCFIVYRLCNRSSNTYQRTNAY